MKGYGRPVAHIRETIEVIRVVIGKSHRGELDRYDGACHQHDWSTFLGPFAPPIRERVPIWLAATSGDSRAWLASCARGSSTTRSTGRGDVGPGA
jgi:alkanesulfonate monooxygenase SsuD/methylene tetrahydromethanopterin reductase-like flavin-dependent oxidoreductase (luciferase family)